MSRVCSLYDPAPAAPAKQEKDYHMSTKRNPGLYNCYANLLLDEPYFVLMGRDPSAPPLVGSWARNRYDDIVGGARPSTDIGMVDEAHSCTLAMRQWHKENDAVWRIASHAADANARLAVREQIGKVSATIGAPPRPNLAPGMWVHYKFGVGYELMHLALNEGTGEWQVVHRNRQTMNIFVRPAREWTELVQTLDGKMVPRFRSPDNWETH